MSGYKNSISDSRVLRVRTDRRTCLSQTSAVIVPLYIS